jgi:hypothetical protein
MEAARTSETLVDFYQTTRCNNTEDSHLLTMNFEPKVEWIFMKLSTNVMPLDDIPSFVIYFST